MKGLFYLLANGFVFSPRRKVELEFCDMTEKVKQASKEGLEVFNQTLEAFYNEKGEEKVSISLTFSATTMSKGKCCLHT